MEPRVKTKIWVQAFMRRIEADGFAAVVVTRGDSDAGAILIKVNRFENGCQVYTQVRDKNGAPAWLVGTGEGAVEETEADTYIARQRTYDADLWVVEVEDPKGRFTMDGVVLES